MLGEKRRELATGLRFFSNSVVENEVEKVKKEGNSNDLNHLRNSIYNFNRVGVAKNKIRTKIMEEEQVNKIADKNRSPRDIVLKCNDLMLKIQSEIKKKGKLVNSYKKREENLLAKKVSVSDFNS